MTLESHPMLFLLSNSRLTPTCTNWLFTKTIPAVWNWWIAWINIAHALNTLGSIAPFLWCSQEWKCCGWEDWYQHATCWSFHQALVTTSFWFLATFAHGMVMFPSFPALLSFSDNAFFFCITVFFCICQTALFSQVHVHEGALTLVLLQWFQNALCNGTLLAESSFTCNLWSWHYGNEGMSCSTAVNHQ